MVSREDHNSTEDEDPEESDPALEKVKEEALLEVEKGSEGDLNDKTNSQATQLIGALLDTALGGASAADFASPDWLLRW